MTPRGGRSPGHRLGAAGSRGSVILLTAAVAAGIAVFFSLYSLIPVTRTDEPGLSSLFVGTMMAFVMGVQVFTPVLVRRFSLRWVLAVSLGLLGAGAGITGFAQGTIGLLAGAVASGAAFGTLVVAGAQGVALLVPVERLGRALGTYGLVTMAASAVGSPAGVQLALTFGSRTFGVCALVVGLLAAGLAYGVPRSVGTRSPDAASSDAATSDTASSSTAEGAGPGGRSRRMGALVAGAPWLVLGLLLTAVTLLSHGLTSLPVLAAPLGGATAVVFAVQVGNAIGRGIGGELEARTSAPTTVLAGALLLTTGAVLGVPESGLPALVVAGALIGLGVGIVQTLALHIAMRRMDSGRASVIWNLAVDGGLWAGGILWGLALASGLVAAGSVALAALVLVLAPVVIIRIRQRSEWSLGDSNP